LILFIIFITNTRRGNVNKDNPFILEALHIVAQVRWD